MRITEDERKLIVSVAREVAGGTASVRLFGSRVDDTLRGGDIDLLISLTAPVERPAMLAAKIASRIERALGGRRIDVLLQAPNLVSLPVHQVALSTGVSL